MMSYATLLVCYIAFFYRLLNVHLFNLSTALAASDASLLLLLAITPRPQVASLLPAGRCRAAGVSRSPVRPGGTQPAPRPSPATHLTSALVHVTATSRGGAGGPLFGDGSILNSFGPSYYVPTPHLTSRPAALSFSAASQNYSSSEFLDLAQPRPLVTPIPSPTSTCHDSSSTLKLIILFAGILNKLCRFDIETLLLISVIESNSGTLNTNVRICNVNINSITAHGRPDELNLFVDDYKEDILGLTETNLDDAVHDRLFRLPTLLDTCSSRVAEIRAAKPLTRSMLFTGDGKLGFLR